MLSINKIICPTDFSDPSYEGLKTAADLAGHFGAELIVVHVVMPMPSIIGAGAPTGFHIPSVLEKMEKRAGEMLENIQERRLPKSVNSRIMVSVGKPANNISETAKTENADLIVISTHGESGWQQLFSGSVTERVIRLAECPVLVVPAPD